MSTDHVIVEVSPDGEVSDLETALARVRELRRPGQRAEVRIAPGRYPMDRPLRLGPDDSGTTFAALDPDDPPVFDGSVVLRDWEPVEVNGVAVWQSPMPRASCRSLFVDGVRRPRPRYPREGSLRIAEQPGLDLTRDMVDVLYQGSDRFHYEAGDAWRFHDLEAVEAVVQHYWIEERMPLVAIDESQRLARSNRTSIFALRDDLVDRFARYYWDNVYESLGEVPGEWYLDRTRGRVLYVPLASDRLEAFEARLPVLGQFVVAHGRPEAAEFVRDVRFEGLCFEYADWHHYSARKPFLVPEDDDLDSDGDYASAPQAGANLEAAIELVGVRGSAVVDCRISSVGGYAVELGDGCQDTVVSGTTMLRLGGGGVKLHGAAEGESANRRNTVSDNTIGHGGEVFPAAVGILTRHSASNTLSHNEIHHFYYSGISVGWVWGYADNPSRDNLIEHNHIHHIGAGVLNDMGGIYLLGVQPGTVIRGNLIHDVERQNYGGWGIYLDHGSSNILVEGNVCHDVDDQCFHVHVGRDNVVRHNIFALGRRGQVEITRIEEDVETFVLEHNVLVSDGQPAISGRTDKADVRRFHIRSDRNVYWDISADHLIAGNRSRGTTAETAGASMLDDPVANDEWVRLGHDQHSRFLDPGFANLAERRFEVADDSALAELGIVLPDVSRAGVRPKNARSSV